MPSYAPLGEEVNDGPEHFAVFANVERLWFHYGAAKDEQTDKAVGVNPQYSRSIGMCTYIKPGMSWGNAACTCQDTYPANNPATGEVLTYSGCTGVAIGTYIPDRPWCAPVVQGSCLAEFTVIVNNVTYSRSIGMCTYIKSGMSWGNAACTCQDTYPANNPATGEVLTYSGCTGVAIGTYIPDRPWCAPVVQGSCLAEFTVIVNNVTPPSFAAASQPLSAQPQGPEPPTFATPSRPAFCNVGFGATAGLYQTTAALAETNCSTNVNCTGFIVADDGRGWYLSAGRILQYSRSIGMCTYIKSGMSWGNAACTCQDTYPADNPATGEVLTYSGCTGVAIGTYIPDRPWCAPVVQGSCVAEFTVIVNNVTPPSFAAASQPLSAQPQGPEPPTFATPSRPAFCNVGFGATAGLYQTTAALAETNCSTNVNCTGFIVADDGRGWYLSAGRILQYSRSVGMCTYIKSGMSWGNAACTCQDTYPADNPATGEVLTYSGCTGVAIGTYIPDRPWCAPVVQGSCLAEFTVIVNNVTPPSFAAASQPLSAQPQAPEPPTFATPSRPAFCNVGFGATAGLYQTTAALAETNCSTNVNCTGFIVADDGRGWYLSAGRILQYSRSIGMCTYIKSGMSWGNAACTCQDTYPADNPATGEVRTYSGCTGVAIGTYIPDRPWCAPVVQGSCLAEFTVIVNNVTRHQ
ncbi:hypothetical protein HYH02_014465 [Chlamydomonas schloesseri]|uniref:Uncharacterized protein n=1 Tax=Chlamydomonas schloesseri TaxID=2026947 RepID=A0A835SQW2_9CHLO|nr:hypothetical protein HYH02_014465 [Chlamydomonas schloesseri]|eukprot:KAG2428073.1 hypothetical protein HYH02_014465 [Chlamydomonas schloesseri]